MHSTSLELPAADRLPSQISLMTRQETVLISCFRLSHDIFHVDAKDKGADR